MNEVHKENLLGLEKSLSLSGKRSEKQTFFDRGAQFRGKFSPFQGKINQEAGVSHTQFFNCAGCMFIKRWQKNK